MYCILFRHNPRMPWQVRGGPVLWSAQGGPVLWSAQEARELITRDMRYDITATEYKVQQLVDVVECP